MESRNSESWSEAPGLTQIVVDLRMDQRVDSIDLPLALGIRSSTSGFSRRGFAMQIGDELSFPEVQGQMAAGIPGCQE